ncbi:MAG: archaellin/type IV pilin N-terminal domain-containing protein [Nitrosopumilaceae archaeon]
MTNQLSGESKPAEVFPIMYFRKKSHKGVAPIIATLLLITIAVIGGVMIYVFTQGFFGNSSISVSPSVDTIVMSGYDMREILDNPPCDNSHSPATRGVTTHEGMTTCHGDDNSGDGKFDEEAGAIFIRNVGNEPYNLSRLEVNGRVLDFRTTDPEISNNAGVFGIYTVPDTQTASAGEILREVATILPGQEGTLVVTFDGSGTSTDNSAANGRTIPIKLISSNGSVYNFNLVIGTKI